VDGVTGENTTYTYDALNRLTAASNSLWNQTYTYDGFGNLLTKSQANGSPNPSPAVSVSYNANNQQTGYNAPTYDSNGNQTYSNGTWYWYSVENRLAEEANQIYQTSYIYAYDPWGKRVMSSNEQGNYIYTFYGITGQPLATLNCNISDYPAYPSCWIAGQNVYYGKKLIVSGGVPVVTDRLGSVRADTQGEQFAYYPFGEERTGTPDGRNKFATYFRDMIGQDYADQRYYGSGTGRFLTVDPGGIATANSADPTSWNRYAYVQGDPINHTDRHGLFLDAEQCIDDPDACLAEDGGGGSGGGCGGYADGFDLLDGPTPDPGCPITPTPPTPPSPPAPDCNSITAAVGFAGLTYQNASEIWNDGSLSSYKTDSAAATIAALAAVTWQGESSFNPTPTNNPNVNDNGVLTSVDYGPMQINQGFNPNSNPAVWGTNGAGQKFNGNTDANITFGIQILEGLYAHYGNNAAGRYVGSLANWQTTTKGHTAGTPINPNAQKREAAWNSWSSRLTALFSNTDCFPHQ
jgi:RHS repeat-associated protein